MTTVYYTEMGMNAQEGHPVKHVITEDGEYYLKEFPAAERDTMYRAYEKLRSLGVGIEFTRTARGVKMAAGTVINRAVRQGRITRANRDELIAKIRDIQRKLASGRWAHTDIKPQNVVIKWRGEGKFDVFLIDNDYAAPFGQGRRVCTPRVNARSTQQGTRGVIDANTDSMGFDAVIQYIRDNVH
eukprot:scpid94352/ scgid33599/ 